GALDGEPQDDVLAPLLRLERLGRLQFDAVGVGEDAGRLDRIRPGPLVVDPVGGHGTSVARQPASSVSQPRSSGSSEGGAGPSVPSGSSAPSGRMARRSGLSSCIPSSANSTSSTGWNSSSTSTPL